MQHPVQGNNSVINLIHSHSSNHLHREQSSARVSSAISLDDADISPKPGIQVSVTSITDQQLKMLNIVSQAEVEAEADGEMLQSGSRSGKSRKSDKDKDRKVDKGGRTDKENTSCPYGLIQYEEDESESDCDDESESQDDCASDEHAQNALSAAVIQSLQEFNDDLLESGDRCVAVQSVGLNGGSILAEYDEFFIAEDADGNRYIIDKHTSGSLWRD